MIAFEESKSFKEGSECKVQIHNCQIKAEKQKDRRGYRKSH